MLSAGKRGCLDFEGTRRGRLIGMDRGLTVSEAAAKVGLSAHTLRWYEQEGLVEPVGRDGAGRRRYESGDVDWLMLLTRLRTTGMSVRDMRRYAELARRGPHTVTERRRLFEEHKARVLERIADLHRDLEAINVKIEIYRRMEHEQQ
jgi:DNA-binding transcriptional MerR regulator